MSNNPQSGGVQQKVALLSDDGSGSVLRTDITSIVHEFHIYEDIFKPTMTAVVSVYDASGAILGNKTWTGQEWIVIGVGSSAYTFRAYKIESIVPSSERAYSYNIHCVSPEFESALNKSIYNYFPTDPEDEPLIGSEIISAIHSEHISASGRANKLVTVEKTDRPLAYTAAGHNPIEFIQMVAADCQSAEYPDSSLMVFYQDRKGFHFKSVNKMLDSRPIAEFYYADPGTERGPRARNYILGITWHDSVDAVNGLRNGLFDNTVMGIDINTKTFKEYTFNYAKQFKEITHIRNGGKPIIRPKSWDGNVLGDQLDGSSHVRMIATDFNTDIENQTIDGRISQKNDPHIFFSKNKHNFLGKSVSLMGALRQYKVDVTSNYIDGVVPGSTVNVHIPSNSGNLGIAERYIATFGQRNPTFLVTGTIITYDGVDGGLFLTLQCTKESLSQGLGGIPAAPPEQPEVPVPQNKADAPDPSGQERAENQTQTLEEAQASVDGQVKEDEDGNKGVPYSKLTPVEKQYAIQSKILDADLFPVGTFE